MWAAAITPGTITPRYRTIEGDLAAAGGWFDGVWACGYRPKGTGALRADHPFRKPNPGMIEAAAAELGLSLEGSWIGGR